MHSTRALVFVVLIAFVSTAIADDNDKPERETIAVIGTGDMGDSLGPKLAEAGYRVIYGSRDPSRESVAALVARTGTNASATTQKAAAAEADIVLLAVPWPPMEQVAQNLGNLDGKIIIDISDPTRQADDGYLEITVDTSSAELIQGWNPGASVVKTPFGASQTIDDPSIYGEPTVTYIAADDPRAKEVVARIAIDLGLFPLDAGPLRVARQMEGLSLLFLAPLLQGRDELWTWVPRLVADLSCLPDNSWFSPVADADDLARFPNLDNNPADCSATSQPAFAAEENLYRITMLRAAPGKWVELKALIENQGEAGSRAEDGRMIPYRMRHSQGAQWDFMLIQPVESLASYFGDETQALETPFRDAASEFADFAEDWVVSGPANDVLKAAYPDAGMFLIEMFRARAGMQEDLVDSRVRENRVLEAIEIPINFVFVGMFGADWDVMTIGFYESFATYGAAGGGVSTEVREKAAHANGFEGMGDLAPSLRLLLTQHSDTLASSMD